jgi:paraquat-inducible protein B
MSDEGRSPPVPLGLAKPRATRRRDWVPSLIWLILLVAQILLDRGPKIEVSFKTAEWLEVGETVVKYKDV